MLDGEVSVRVGPSYERIISGWTSVRILRSLEQIPNTFEIGFTSDHEGRAGTLVNEGEPCQVFIDGDLVVTGYADVVQSDSDKGSHSLSIAGRGKCQDLLDCAAEWEKGSVINQTSIDGIATILAEPYGIEVPPAPAGTPPIPFFDITLIESPFALIEEVARYCELLVYEDEAGDLILAKVGEEAAASGFTEGENCERIRVTRSAQDRYSEYLGFNQSVITVRDINADLNVRARAEDNGLPPRADGAPRHRRKAIVVEAPSGTNREDVGTRRVKWEQSRRAGNSRQALVTTSGWRDADGDLWAPNSLAPLSLPSHGVEGATWVIGQVILVRDQEGTRTELLLKPREAFSPEPIQLGGILSDVDYALAHPAAPQTQG